MGSVQQVVGYWPAEVAAVVEGARHLEHALAVPAEIQRGQARSQNRPRLQPEGLLPGGGASHGKGLDPEPPQRDHQ